MKRNFKYVKKLGYRLNHKGERVPVYKKVSANKTTWAPSRPMSVVFENRKLKERISI